MTASVQPPVESALQKERRLFGELFDRFINSLLNWMFDLRPERAQRRIRNLVILFLLSGFLLYRPFAAARTVKFAHRFRYTRPP